MGDATKRLGTFADRLFTGYANLAVRRSLVLWLVGLVLGVAFCLGILVAKVEDRDVNALWIDLDSRIVDENKALEEAFGGPRRGLFAIVSGRELAGGAALFDSSDTTGRQNNALDALRDAMLVWANVNTTYQGGTYRNSDFCERSVPPVPFQPGQSSSTLYRLYSECMATDTLFTSFLYTGIRNLYPSLPATFSALPQNWGLRKLPCNRASALDCFREGEQVDWPEELRQVGEVALPLATAISTTYSTLLAQVKATPISVSGLPGPLPVDTVLNVLGVPCWFTSVTTDLSCLAADPSVALNNPQAYAAAVATGLVRLNGTFATQSSALIAPLNAVIAPSVAALTAMAASPTTPMAQVQGVAAMAKTGIIGILQAAAASSPLLGTIVTYIRLDEMSQTSPVAPVGAMCMSAAAQNHLNIADPNNINVRMAQAQLGEAALFLSSVGYWWRPSYKNMTQAEIVEHFNLAANAQIDPAVRGDRAKCLTDKAVRCCQTWSGTFIGTALLVAGKPKPAGRAVPGSELTSLDLDKVTLLQSGWSDYNEKSPVWQDQLAQEHPNVTWSTGDTQPQFAYAFDNAVTVEWLKLYKREAGTPFASGGIYPDYRFDFSTGVSLPDLLEDGTKLEASLLGLSYGLMVLLVVLSLGNYFSVILNIGDAQAVQFAMVNSHSVLGVFGLLVIALGSTAAIGFASYVQIPLNAVTINLVPFISLGLGIDDMFVLAHTMISTNDRSRSVAHNMGAVLRLAGPSVCLTSIANAVAFILIYYVPITAVRQLVLTLMIAVLMNLLFLFLIFVPMMIWDLKRNHANRIDVLFIRATLVDKSTALSEKKSKPLLERFIDGFYAPLLANRIVKLVVVLLFTSFFTWALYNGIANTKQGLRTSDVALIDSYQRDLAVLAEAEFPVQSASLLTRARAYNFSNPLAQQQLLNTLDILDASPWLVPGMRVHDSNYLSNGSASLLAFYDRIHGSLAAAGCPPANVSVPISSVACYDRSYTLWVGAFSSLLYPFLSCQNASTGQRVPCSQSGAVLTSVRSNYYLNGVTTTSTHLEAISDVRRRVDMYSDGNVQSVSTGFVFNFWEQYYGIETTLIAAIGFGLLGVFFVTFIFQLNPWLSVIVCTVILMIVVELVGLMDPMSVKLNAFSLANLVISIGMAVEFCAHIARSFLVAAGTKDERTKVALREMLQPMVYGALSTIIAVAVLALARYPFFRNYYALTYVVMVLVSFGNGLVFLPVVLSLIGPKAAAQVEPEDYGTQEDEAEMDDMEEKKLTQADTQEVEVESDQVKSPDSAADVLY